MICPLSFCVRFALAKYMSVTKYISSLLLSFLVYNLVCLYVFVILFVLIHVSVFPYLCYTHYSYTIKYHSTEFSLRIINAVNKLINNVSRYFVFITNVLIRTRNLYLCCTLQQTVARLVIVDEDLKTLLVGFEGNVLLNIFGHNWLY